MGITSAGLHERDAGCGNKRATERRDESAKNVVHYLVSPPHAPRASDKPKLDIPQSKAAFCKYRLLNPAGSGDTRIVRFFNEPRAAFYTEKRGKMQNKNVRVAANVRKNCHPYFNNATCIKKGWKWD
jgi:hypothetical protein